MGHAQRRGGAAAPALSPLEALQAALTDVQGAGAVEFANASTTTSTFANLIPGGASVVAPFSRKFTSASATLGGLRSANMDFKFQAPVTEAPATGLLTYVALIYVPGTADPANPASYNLAPSYPISAFGNPATPLWVNEVSMATLIAARTAIGYNQSAIVRFTNRAYETGANTGGFGSGTAPWWVRRLACIPQDAANYAAAGIAALDWMTEVLP